MAPAEPGGGASGRGGLLMGEPQALPTSLPRAGKRSWLQRLCFCGAGSSSEHAHEQPGGVDGARAPWRKADARSGRSLKVISSPDSLNADATKAAGPHGAERAPSSALADSGCPSHSPSGALPDGCASGAAGGPPLLLATLTFNNVMGQVSSVNSLRLSPSTLEAEVGVAGAVAAIAGAAGGAAGGNSSHPAAVATAVAYQYSHSSYAMSVPVANAHHAASSGTVNLAYASSSGLPGAQPSSGANSGTFIDLPTIAVAGSPAPMSPLLVGAAAARAAARRMVSPEIGSSLSGIGAADGSSLSSVPGRGGGVGPGTGPGTGTATGVPSGVTVGGGIPEAEAEAEAEAVELEVLPLSNAPWLPGDAMEAAGGTAGAAGAAPPRREGVLSLAPARGSDASNIAEVSSPLSPVTSAGLSAAGAIGVAAAAAGPAGTAAGPGLPLAGGVSLLGAAGAISAVAMRQVELLPASQRDLNALGPGLGPHPPAPVKASSHYSPPERPRQPLPQASASARHPTSAQLRAPDHHSTLHGAVPPAPSSAPLQPPAHLQQHQQPYGPQAPPGAHRPGFPPPALHTSASPFNSPPTSAPMAPPHAPRASHTGVYGMPTSPHQPFLPPHSLSHSHHHFFPGPPGAPPHFHHHPHSRSAVFPGGMLPGGPGAPPPGAGGGGGGSSGTLGRRSYMGGGYGLGGGSRRGSAAPDPLAAAGLLPPSAFSPSGAFPHLNLGGGGTGGAGAGGEGAAAAASLHPAPSAPLQMMGSGAEPRSAGGVPRASVNGLLSYAYANGSTSAYGYGPGDQGAGGGDVYVMDGKSVRSLALSTARNSGGLSPRPGSAFIYSGMGMSVMGGMGIGGMGMGGMQVHSSAGAGMLGGVMGGGVAPAYPSPGLPPSPPRSSILPSRVSLSGAGSVLSLPIETNSLADVTVPHTGLVGEQAALEMGLLAPALDLWAAGAHVSPQSKISAGAYGVVYRGLWHGCTCAVKLMLAASTENLSSQLTEVFLCKALSCHPNIVQTFDCNVWRITADTLVAVQYLCEGGAGSPYIGGGGGGGAGGAASAGIMGPYGGGGSGFSPATAGVFGMVTNGGSGLTTHNASPATYGAISGTWAGGGMYPGPGSLIPGLGTGPVAVHAAVGGAGAAGPVTFLRPAGPSNSFSTDVVPSALLAGQSSVGGPATGGGTIGGGASTTHGGGAAASTGGGTLPGGPVGGGGGGGPALGGMFDTGTHCVTNAPTSTGTLASSLPGSVQDVSLRRGGSTTTPHYQHYPAGAILESWSMIGGRPYSINTAGAMQMQVAPMSSASGGTPGAGGGGATGPGAGNSPVTPDGAAGVAAASGSGGGGAGGAWTHADVASTLARMGSMGSSNNSGGGSGAPRGQQGLMRQRSWRDASVTAAAAAAAGSSGGGGGTGGGGPIAPGGAAAQSLLPRLLLGPVSEERLSGPEALVSASDGPSGPQPHGSLSASHNNTAPLGSLTGALGGVLQLGSSAGGVSSTPLGGASLAGGITAAAGIMLSGVGNGPGSAAAGGAGSLTNFTLSGALVSPGSPSTAAVGPGVATSVAVMARAGAMEAALAAHAASAAAVAAAAAGAVLVEDASPLGSGVSSAPLSLAAGLPATQLSHSLQRRSTKQQQSSQSGVQTSLLGRTSLSRGSSGGASGGLASWSASNGGGSGRPSLLGPRQQQQQQQQDLLPQSDQARGQQQEEEEEQDETEVATAESGVLAAATEGGLAALAEAAGKGAPPATSVSIVASAVGLSPSPAADAPAAAATAAAAVAATETVTAVATLATDGGISLTATARAASGSGASAIAVAAAVVTFSAPASASGSRPHLVRTGSSAAAPESVPSTPRGATGGGGGGGGLGTAAGSAGASVFASASGGAGAGAGAGSYTAGYVAAGAASMFSGGGGPNLQGLNAAALSTQSSTRSVGGGGAGVPGGPLGLPRYHAPGYAGAPMTGPSNMANAASAALAAAAAAGAAGARFTSPDAYTRMSSPAQGAFSRSVSKRSAGAAGIGGGGGGGGGPLHNGGGSGSMGGPNGPVGGFAGAMPFSPQGLPPAAGSPFTAVAAPPGGVGPTAPAGVLGIGGGNMGLFMGVPSGPLSSSQPHYALCSSPVSSGILPPSMQPSYLGGGGGGGGGGFGVAGFGGAQGLGYGQVYGQGVGIGTGGGGGGSGQNNTGGGGGTRLLSERSMFGMTALGVPMVVNSVAAASTGGGGYAGGYAAGYAAASSAAASGIGGGGMLHSASMGMGLAGLAGGGGAVAMGMSSMGMGMAMGPTSVSMSGPLQPKSAVMTGDEGDAEAAAAGARNLAQVLQLLGARDGQLAVVVVMEECDRGSLQQLLNKSAAAARTSLDRGGSAGAGGFGSGAGGMAGGEAPRPPTYAPFSGGGRYPPAAALRALVMTAKEVALGMAFLHVNNIIHGDLKPGNVLMKSSRQDQRGFIVKISDFGLSRVMHHTAQPQTGLYAVGAIEPTVSGQELDPREGGERGSGGSGGGSGGGGGPQGALDGTVPYLAPELINHSQRSKASDVWAYGVLLWQLVTGRRPYEGLMHVQIMAAVCSGEQLLNWPPDAHAALVHLGRACLAFNPRERPTFAQIVRRLQSLEQEIRHM